MNAADATHIVTNQPPPLAGYNAWTQDRVLIAAAKRAQAGWIEGEATAMGELAGTERMQALADQANRYGPVLKTHDRFGHRIDAVEFHPAYHELMALAFGAGLHSLAWTAKEGRRFAARAALNYLWNQGEQGISCPVTMTFAGVQMLRNAPALAARVGAEAARQRLRPAPAAGRAEERRHHRHGDDRETGRLGPALQQHASPGGDGELCCSPGTSGSALRRCATPSLRSRASTTA